jgi:O-antigen ligase
MAEPHSVFVQAVVETGLLGIAALVGVVVAIWRDLAAARRRAGTGIDRWMALGATAVAAGMFVQMFTENLLTQVAIHLYLWIPVAYATSMLRRPPGTASPDAHGAAPATGIGGSEPAGTASEPAGTASDDPSVVDGAA